MPTLSGVLIRIRWSRASHRDYGHQMALRVIGAGVGRTGTTSLKTALERLLGERCYHGWELLHRPDDVPLWESALDGDPDWATLFDGYGAAIDWPTAAFWRELSWEYPDAVVVLSTRPADEWWESAEATIFAARSTEAPPPFQAMRAMLSRVREERFTSAWADRDAAIRAYELHNQQVRAAVPGLVEWSPSDGWEPLCRALNVEPPTEPFPHLNRAADFRSTARLDS